MRPFISFSIRDKTRGLLVFVGAKEVTITALYKVSFKTFVTINNRLAV
jgi:hypothetical protein